MILREVQSHEYCGACRYTGYIAKSIMLKLVCGHEQYRKASAGVPVKARCRECERLEDDRIKSMVDKMMRRFKLELARREMRERTKQR